MKHGLDEPHGHAVVLTQSQNQYSNPAPGMPPRPIVWDIECSCGKFTNNRNQELKNGGFGVRVQRQWAGHLEAANADPNLKIDVGSVTMKRMKKTFSVILQDRPDFFEDWVKGTRYENWYNNRNRYHYQHVPWCAVEESRSLSNAKAEPKRKILGFHASSSDAVDHAKTAVERGEDKGNEIEFFGDHVGSRQVSIEMVSLDISSAVAELCLVVDEAIEEDKLEVLARAARDVRDALRTVKVLQVKEQQIQDHIDKKVLATAEDLSYA